jgi:hypothetical protein
MAKEIKKNLEICNKKHNAENYGFNCANDDVLLFCVTFFVLEMRCFKSE